jgi:epoxyqueuosine reductase
MTHTDPENNLQQFVQRIKQWALELGFADCGISQADLSQYEARYFSWLEQNFHGEMHYMQQHGTKRTRPNELIPGTLSIISLRMNYFEDSAQNALSQLHQNDKAYISRYALGRDYHKLMRNRLKALVTRIREEYPHIAQRIFVDSAPVLERPIAHQAGLGFIGKNSLIIHPRAGSWFFLAEIYTDLPLPNENQPKPSGCGPCQACIIECPTQAIVDEGVVDARRCISYLTIEHPGSIPVEFRQAMGNRIYGCDDCQLVCPWNHFTQPNQEPDFKPRHQLDRATLVELFNWTEEAFNKKLEGSPIRRIGYERWLRNIAIALGNAPKTDTTIEALRAELGKVSEMVDEHIEWALEQATRPGGYYEIKPEEIKPFKAAKYYLGRKNQRT